MHREWTFGAGFRRDGLEQCACDLLDPLAITYERDLWTQNRRIAQARCTRYRSSWIVKKVYLMFALQKKSAALRTTLVAEGQRQQMQTALNRTGQQRKRRARSRYSNRTFYLFIAPWLLGFLLLTVVPMGYALLVSFTNFDGVSSRWHWIGLRNYVELFQNPETWLSLERTLGYMLLIVPLTIIGGLGLALLVNQNLRGISAFRLLFYLPSVVPLVATAVIWRSMFDQNAGLVNAIIEDFGGHGIVWLSDSNAFVALIVLTLWGIGGGMIYNLAGLQAIPQELIEAAKVDGANPWQRFRSVLLPLLTPVLFFQVVLGVIGALQTFTQPLLLAQNGGPATTVTVQTSTTSTWSMSITRSFTISVLAMGRPCCGSSSRVFC